MTKQRPSTLREALDFRLFSELLKYDLYIAIAGGVGGTVAAVKSITPLPLLISVAAGLVGVIIGAVIAGVAVLAAFMDQVFLRKLKAINREPVRYLAPFIFTAVLGVVASLALLIFAAMPSDAPGWLRGVAGCLAGLFVTWTIASLLPDLKMLVDFVGLKMDATEVPDDVGLPQSAPRRIAPRGQGEA
jgi:hypothetical protein